MKISGKKKSRQKNVMPTYFHVTWFWVKQLIKQNEYKLFTGGCLLDWGQKSLKIYGWFVYIKTSNVFTKTNPFWFHADFKVDHCQSRRPLNAFKCVDCLALFLFLCIFMNPLSRILPSWSAVLISDILLMHWLSRKLWVRSLRIVWHCNLISCYIYVVHFFTFSSRYTSKSKNGAEK